LTDKREMTLEDARGMGAGAIAADNLTPGRTWISLIGSEIHGRVAVALHEIYPASLLGRLDPV
jgi:hypothetical protein